MNVLLDTNLLTRTTQAAHPQHQTALDATFVLRQRGDVLCVVPQVLYEFWVVATRPTSVNGLGLVPAVAWTELLRLKSLFQFFADTPDVYTEWERLVSTHQVSGKRGHDARLVAAMSVHGITHLLTFNTADFAGFPGVTPLDPAAVSASP